MKSWVVGIKTNGFEKAYDWNDLLKNYFIQDTIGNIPVLLTLENDTSSFHALNRNIQGRMLFFIQDKAASRLSDSNTHSIWTPDGVCISGPLKDAKLEQLSAYQEFWHSWEHFHPNTYQYKP
jgi:hypothetical protein